MTLGELIDNIEEITGEHLTSIKTQDNKIIQLVDIHREAQVLIIDNMIYTNRYDIDTLISMTFEEYIQYIKDLNDVEE